MTRARAQLALGAAPGGSATRVRGRIPALPEVALSGSKTGALAPRWSAAILSEMGRAILLAEAGETFVLSDTPVWCRPLAASIELDLEGGAS